MNITKDTANRGEDVYDILTAVCTYYGLTWCQIRSGILIYNGSEYWVIKFKKDSGNVRLLLHQNHGRQGNTIPL